MVMDLLYHVVASKEAVVLYIYRPNDPTFVSGLRMIPPSHSFSRIDKCF